MNRKLFESFYKGNIEVIANALVKEHPEFSYIENPGGVYEEYLNQKTLLKLLIKGTTESITESIDEDTRNAVLLDGHKVSACICCAIIKTRLISSNTINDDYTGTEYSLKNASRINEQLAALSGISCLLEYMCENQENLFENPEDHSKVNLIFPETYYIKQDNSEYRDSLVRALFYSNLYSDINPLLLSHIFFFIELNHRTQVELRMVKKELELLRDAAQ